MDGLAGTKQEFARDLGALKPQPAEWDAYDGQQHIRYRDGSVRDNVEERRQPTRLA